MVDKDEKTAVDSGKSKAMKTAVREKDGSSFAKEVIKVPSDKWLDENYLIYSLYVIQDRALVSTDGLKPVNRRILYSMLQNSGASPNADFVKAARVAANTVAYHPHGNTSIEETLARMGQKFTMRVPLIDVQGSVGYQTGDSPASARYWEARMTPAAIELVKEVKDHAVPIGRNFDQKLDEAHSLPVRFPNEIINGTEGMAVGYASAIISHNPDETMNAAIRLLEKGEPLTTDELLSIMPGPDFATGGEVIGTNGIRDYYETGKGTIVIRGKHRVHQLNRGKVQFEFYELPYQVSAAKIKDQIKKRKDDGGFKDIVLFEDFSDKKSGLSFIVETRSGANQMNVLSELYKYTNIEVKKSVNTTVLVNNRPNQVGIGQLLQNFVDFRRYCNENKAVHLQDVLGKRSRQLDGVLKILVDLDKVISIIRNSDTGEEARSELMSEFGVTEEQADYVLSMQLRRLTKADSLEIEKENESIKHQLEELDKRLHDPEVMTQHIIDELKATKKIISSPRRTIINAKTIEQLKEEQKDLAKSAKEIEKNSPCYVTKFVDGTFMRTMDPFTHNKEKGSYTTPPVVESIKTRTKEELFAVFADGSAKKFPVAYMPDNKIVDSKGLGFSDPVMAVGKMNPMKSETGLIMGTRNGEVKLLKTDYPNRDEFPVFNVGDDDEIISGVWLSRAPSNYKVVFGSSDSNTLVFSADSLRQAGHRSGGVRGFKVKEGSEVVFFGVTTSMDSELLTSSGVSVKSTQLREIPEKNRGGQGVVVHKLLKKESQIESMAVAEHPVMMEATEKVPMMAPVSSPRGKSGTPVDFPVLIGELREPAEDK